MRHKRKLNNWYWWCLTVAPILFAFALFWNSPSTLIDFVGTGTSFGFFGRWFVQVVMFFVDQLNFMQFLLISLVDWCLSVQLLRVCYGLLNMFVSWLYDFWERKEKDA